MIELEIDRVATGGDGVAREPGGRVVFVAGGLPGDLVLARLVREKEKMAWADIVEVLRPSPMRVNPPCPHLAQGCGGCDFQHVSPSAQHELKLAIVADTLERIGKIDSINPTFGGAVASFGYRTTVRAAVTQGRAGCYARLPDCAPCGA